jgi:hypothetical protein
MAKRLNMDMLFNSFIPNHQTIQQQSIPTIQEQEDVSIDPSIAIDTLQRRIVELEKEVKTLTEKDNRPWCFSGNQPGYVRSGMTQEQYIELEKISKHFNSKANSDIWLMMAHCWQAPIPTREKMVLFFLCMVNMKQVKGGM